MNYYTVGVEGMPKLILEIENPLDNFKKKLYADAFKKYYESNLSIYEAIENHYQEAEDPEGFLKELGVLAAGTAAEELEKITKKSKQEKVMIDYNLCIAVYVIPGILEFKGKSSQPLADAVLAAWKERFPKTNVQAASFEQINSGFQRKYCYITTAVCETFGKPDDCYELTLLRSYRDHYLAEQKDGEEVIRTYYDLAPTIVKHISRQENSGEIYQHIWDTYLNPCIRMIESNEKASCKDLYIKMVRDLEEQYFQM